MTTLGRFFGFGMNGTEIYHNFRDGTGDDGRGLYMAADTVGTLHDNYDQRKDSIKDLVVRMESAWQGNASGAAQRGAGPLAVEHGLAAPEINTAQQALTNQVTVFGSAQGRVVEVPPEPEEPGFWDNFTSFGGASRDYQTAKAEYDAANDHNVAIMEEYEGETDTNTSAMPTSYGSIAPDHASVGVREQMGPNQPLPWEQPSDPGTGDPGGNNNYSNNNNNYGNTNNDSQNQNNDQYQNGNNNGQTNPNDYTGITNPADRPGNDPRFPPPPITNPGPNPNNPNNMHPPGLMPSTFGPNGGGDNARTGTGYGRGGGPGGSGFGPGGSGSGGGAGGSGARGGMGGAMPGAAAAAEGAAARPGAAGLRGGPGMMGGGGMGAGGRRQDGEDDTEHERPSFLVEPDPHDTFGTSEVTAPPVIGE